jgi:hypothetical protein
MTETTATEKQNAKLEHVAGGSTTRDDALDAGVPMLQGDPSERVGPEDALGVGDKRGDYRDRVPGNPYETVPNPNAGQPITAWVKEDGSPAKKGDKGATEVVVDYEPNRGHRGREGQEGRRRHRRRGRLSSCPRA